MKAITVAFFTSSLCLATPILHLATGGSHNCALIEGGQVKCWGYNVSGQLGLGTTVQVIGISPRQMGDSLPFVNLGEEAQNIFAGTEHTCALLKSGVLKCWGKNENGELGLGDSRPRGFKPGDMGSSLSAVNLGKKVIKATLGPGFTCAILEDGLLKCWGKNAEAELGLGHTQSVGSNPEDMQNLLPVNLGARQRVSDVCLGAVHACALLEDKSVKCWGSNVDGVLGNGIKYSMVGKAPEEMGDSLKTVDVGKEKIKALECNATQTCVITESGSIKCWGKNIFGALGNGKMNSQGEEPGQMGEALPATLLGTGQLAVQMKTNGSMSGQHSCVIFPSHLLKCWGANYAGQLGLGDNESRGADPKRLGDELPFVDLGNSTWVKELGLGQAHSCALLENGRIKCWGNNTLGQLGLGDRRNRGLQESDMGELLPYVDLGN